MDIGIDARFAGGRLSGIGRYTYNLLSGIAATAPERRFAVFIRNADDLPNDVASCPLFEFVEIPRNPRGLADQWLMPRQIRRMGLRLLHSTDAFAPLWARGIARVVTIHDLIPLIFRKDNPRSVKSRYAPIWKAWLLTQCRRADIVMPPSEHSGRDIETLLGVPWRKIRVVPNAVRPFDMEQGRRLPGMIEKLCIEGKFLLYVGRRDPYKNLPGLICAFAEIRHAYVEPVTLVIAGPGDARYPEPEQAVQSLGLNGSVIFTGHMSDEQLMGLYEAASVFVFPSLYEGFGLPPLEAMHFGVPVVASRSASLPEVLGSAAVLVDAADPGAMARAVLRVLSDHALACELRRKGKERAAMFSLKRQGMETLRVYEEILSP